MQYCQYTSTNKYKCITCNKEYTRKSSLDKHKLLCDFRTKTQREINIETEESADIPNHNQLAKIVQELMIRMIKMEDKMEEMHKFIEKKKRKMNVISWLNSNINPTVGFKEWLNTYIIVKPEHFESLMNNTIFYSIQQIFEDNLSTQEFIYPIRCFTQKNGIFYICDKNDEGKPDWRQQTFEELVLIIKKIQNGLMKELTQWKTINQNKFDQNDKLSILFNKAVIKLMSINFTQDNNFSRMKNGFYNYLKKDLTSFEFDFEF